MDRMLWRFVVVVSVVVGARVASAQPTFYVAPCGNDSHLGTNPVCQAGDTFGPLRTIQRALDRIATFGVGGTVVVTPGFWNERLYVGGGDITIRSATAGSNVYIQPVGGTGRVILRQAGAGQTLTMEDVWLLGGSVAGNGGGLRVEGGNLAMTSCAVGDCTAQGNGGGVSFVGGGTLKLTSCIFTGNYASSLGGAVTATGAGNTTIAQCLFLQNAAGTGGHVAIDFPAEGASTVLRECEMHEGTAVIGSAIGLGGMGVVIDRCIIADNTATSDSAGGAIYGTVGKFTVTGGAIRYNDGIVSGVLTYFCEASYKGVTFEGNQGVAALIAYSQQNVFDRCRFVGAGRTGTHILEGSSVVAATNCLFEGAQIALDGDNMRVDHCTLVGQTVHPLRPDTKTYVANSIVWDQVAGPLGTGFTVASSIVQFADQWPAGDRVFEVDPMLDGGRRPRVNSRAIDAGSTPRSLSDLADSDNDGNTGEALPYDLDGYLRFIDDFGVLDSGVGAPPLSDLGAFEFQGMSCAADYDGDGFISGPDFDQFVIDFEEGDLLADFDRDGFVTGQDFDSFVATYESGC